jgi:iron complex outermembrane receptor protein
LRKKGEGYQWITDIAYKKLSDEYLFRPGTTPNQNYTQLWVAQSYAQLSAGRTTSLTTGVQFIGKSIRSNDRGNHNLPHAAIFITASHRIKNQLFINESLRLDWDGNYGTVLVPQVNIAWSPSRFTFRGSWGTGIRDADFTERFNNYNKTRVTSGSIGNPDLRTEQSQNYELGADYRLLKGLKISAGLFRRAQRDLIDWTPTPYAEMPRQSNLVPGGTYALATNLSRVTTQGAELDLQWRKSTHKAELIWMSGWLWLRSTAADKTPSFYISSHARFLLTNSVSITQGQFTLSANTLNKVRNVMASSALNTSLSRTYMLANLRLHYRIPKTGLSIFGQCYNLLNQRYSDLLGAQMPGRWWSAGVNINR